jgi:hypothetical protein
MVDWPPPTYDRGRRVNCGKGPGEAVGDAPRGTGEAMLSRIDDRWGGSARAQRRGLVTPPPRTSLAQRCGERKPPPHQRRPLGVGHFFPRVRSDIRKTRRVGSFQVGRSYVYFQGSCAAREPESSDMHTEVRACFQMPFRFRITKVRQWVTNELTGSSARRGRGKMRPPKSSAALIHSSSGWQCLNFDSTFRTGSNRRRGG